MHTSLIYGLAGLVCLTATAMGQAGDVQKPEQPGALLIDHQDTDITRLTLADIQQAKEALHIVYGHTSHGSQLVAGMQGLVGFANQGGKGLDHPRDTFAFNVGGRNGCLDLHDRGMGGRDLGYYPDWVEETRAYLDDPQYANCNVVMWSWCGQVTGRYRAGLLAEAYLLPMSQLESDYPHVTFVYMTGHVDIRNDADNKAANDVIRRYCAENGKVLYDFADIERYDPDGNYYEFSSDNCDYYDDSSRSEVSGNWAREWQAEHKKGVDWFQCGSAHSQPLNANQKAYAAWALFVELAKR